MDEVLPREVVPRSDLSYGPEPDELELLLARLRQGRLTQNTSAEMNSITAARDERKAQIEKISGKPYAEALQPYEAEATKRVPSPGMAPSSVAGAMAAGINAERAREDAAADMLVQDMQQQGTGMELLRSEGLRSRARELAYQSTLDTQDVEKRDRSSLSGAVAGFIGDAGNSFSDPAILGLLPLGLATDGLGIGALMAAEGALAGTGSAISMNNYAKWQKEIGLPEMTTGEKVGQVAFDAALAAGTAGVLKGGSLLLKTRITPRQAVDAYDRAFPAGSAEDPDLRARRDLLNTMAELVEDNPLPDTPTGEAEHLKRVASVSKAMENDEPLPRFAEDIQVSEPPTAPKSAPPIEDLKPSLETPLDPPAVLVKERKRGELNRPLNVLEFIAKKGGLRDDGGQLTARGMNTRASMTYHGPWFRRKGEVVEGDVFGGRARTTGKGKSPEEMTQLLKDNGFLREVADDGAPVQLTPDDMYALIDEQLGGRTIVSADDLERQFEIDDAAKVRASEAKFRDKWEPEFGKDWDLPEIYGEDFAREAKKAKRAGVKWDRDDLAFAFQWHKENPTETMRVAIEDSLHHKFVRQYQAAKDLEDELVGKDPGFKPDGPPDDFDVELDSLPVGTDEAGNTITFGQLARTRRGEPEIAGPRDGPGRQSPAPGQSGAGTVDDQLEAGQPDAESPGLLDAIAEETEVADPAQVRAAFDHVPEPDDVAAIDAELKQMEAEIRARFDEGAELDVGENEPGFASVRDLLDDLAADDEFVAAVKVCLT